MPLLGDCKWHNYLKRVHGARERPGWPGVEMALLSTRATWLQTLVKMGSSANPLGTAAR